MNLLEVQKAITRVEGLLKLIQEARQRNLEDWTSKVQNREIAQQDSGYWKGFSKGLIQGFDLGSIDLINLDAEAVVNILSDGDHGSENDASIR